MCKGNCELATKRNPRRATKRPARYQQEDSAQSKFHNVHMYEHIFAGCENSAIIGQLWQLCDNHTVIIQQLYGN